MSTHDLLYAAGHALLRATHGLYATHRTVAGQSTANILVLCRFLDETTAEIEVAFSDVASPVVGDRLFIDGVEDTVCWYVVEVLGPLSTTSADPASVLRCSTNRVRQ